GTGRVTLEAVGAVGAAETIHTVGLALPPRDPQERRRRLGAVVLPAHARYLPRSGHGRGDPDLPRGRSSGRLARRALGSPLRCHPTPPASGMHPRPVEIAPKRPPPAQIWERPLVKTGGSLGHIPVPPLVADGGDLSQTRVRPQGEGRDLSRPHGGQPPDRKKEPPLA